jgi:hypothetical protein
LWWFFVLVAQLRWFFGIYSINHGIFVGVVCMAFSKNFCFFMA